MGPLYTTTSCLVMFIQCRLVNQCSHFLGGWGNSSKSCKILKTQKWQNLVNLFFRFDERLLLNAVNRTNILYGALDINVGNIIYVHGSVDPWHALGIYQAARKPYDAILVKGIHFQNILKLSPYSSVLTVVKFWDMGRRKVSKKAPHPSPVRMLITSSRSN